MPFLDRNISRNDPFSKVLFYSVLLHYATFFILIGNPFLLLNNKEDPLERERSMEVQLLSPPKAAEEEPQPVRTPFPKSVGTDSIPQENLALSRDLEAVGTEELEQSPSSDTLPSLRKENLGDLNSQTPTFKTPKKVARKLPPNMTGPEDCMLKVVGMVCPSGTSECIEAYKDFCASLPK